MNGYVLNSVLMFPNKKMYINDDDERTITTRRTQKTIFNISYYQHL